MLIKPSQRCIYSTHLKITTSTGEPIQTAKNPAPRPAKR